MDGLWRLLHFVARSTKRLAILVVGLGVVAVGIVMIPAPGPGWLVVFAGLALLATEFTWAEILLERAKRQATKAKRLAVRSVQSRRRTTPVGSPDGSPNGSGELAQPTDAISADAPNGGNAHRPDELEGMASKPRSA